MSLFELFKTNKTKEVEGVEITYAANPDGSKPTFRISRMSRSNTRYGKTVERETRPVRRQMETETLDNKLAQEIDMRIFCQSVLLGWENVFNQDGTKIEFTVDNAMQLFDALPDLYDDLKTQAGKASTFRDAEVEGQAKN